VNRTLLLTTMSVFVAIGTIGSQLLWFPAGIAKAYPVQHAINVIAAIMLGPGPAVAIAFMIGLLRNMLGIGSLLAFPGGMIGALLAGYFYQRVRKKGAAVLGEIIGSGIFASLLSVPIANILMGSSAGVLFFLPSFAVSSITGGLIGWLLVDRINQLKPLPQI